MPIEMHLPMHLGEFKQQVRKKGHKKKKKETEVTNVGERGEENQTEDAKEWKLGQLSDSGPELLRALLWAPLVTRPAYSAEAEAVLPPREGGSGRGSHCTTCSVSPGCALQEALPGQSRTCDLCETPQMPWTEASASTPGTRDSNALLQLPKPHTNPQGYPRTPSETPSPVHPGHMCRGSRHAQAPVLAGP